jgi:hypothetical protein
MNNLHDGFLSGARKEASRLKNFLRVLAITDGGDSSLYLKASGSDSLAGFTAPVKNRPLSPRPRPPYTDRSAFSSFVVTVPVMHDSLSKMPRSHAPSRPSLSRWAFPIKANDQTETYRPLKVRRLSEILAATDE